MDMLPCLSMGIKQMVTDNTDPHFLSKVVPWSTKAYKCDWVKRTPVCSLPGIHVVECFVTKGACAVLLIQGVLIRNRDGTGSPRLT